MKVVRCPNGCRRDFLRYRHWHESIQPIVKKHYKGALEPRWSGLMYCCDCAEEFFFLRVTNNQKEELDRLLGVVEDDRVKFIKAEARKKRKLYEDFDAYYEAREAAA